MGLYHPTPRRSLLGDHVLVWTMEVAVIGTLCLLVLLLESTSQSFVTSFQISQSCPSPYNFFSESVESCLLLIDDLL